MLVALTAAQEAGLDVDEQAIESGLSYLDDLTAPDGRVGYEALGQKSSRIPGINDYFPRDKTEALTAAGVLSRSLRRQSPKRHPEIVQGAELMLKALPVWDPEDRNIDFYYWYHGTYAMFQLGAVKSKYWKSWNSAIKETLLESQEEQGHAKGSWDPIGPWGFAGGRIYSTALGVLCLEVHIRYARVLPKR